VKNAHERNVIVSCDLNYRAKLWDYGKAPQEVMSKIMPYVDVCIANEEDIQKMLGISADEHMDLADMSADSFESRNATNYYKILCQRLVVTYPNIKTVAISLRESVNADINNWSACIYTNNNFYMSNKFKITDIVDRVGGGDSFSGALIHGLANYILPERALEFAVAASCLKHSIMGDFNRFSEVEVINLVKGNSSGRIQR
jgi:2-dehydro-3-deoxygluconokinase